MSLLKRIPAKPERPVRMLDEQKHPYKRGQQKDPLISNINNSDFQTTLSADCGMGRYSWMTINKWTKLALSSTHFTLQLKCTLLLKNKFAVYKHIILPIIEYGMSVWESCRRSSKSIQVQKDLENLV